MKTASKIITDFSITPSDFSPKNQKMDHPRHTADSLGGDQSDEHYMHPPQQLAAEENK